MHLSASSRPDSGFSLIELLVTLAVTLALGATVVSVLHRAPEMFAVQTERADMHQRLRVAVDSLSRDVGDSASPVAFAPILPYRAGADPPGTFKTNTVTVISQHAGPGPPITTTYWLKSDVAAVTFQLMSHAGGISPDVPVVDNVVALSFAYLGDPRPPTARKPLDEPEGPWTTYGPVPANVAIGDFAAGENCVFVSDGSGIPAPRLAVLGPPGVALVPLDAAQLGDGPWCPDAGSADRWDADLLRVRSVVVTIRVQAANAALRGPAGALFVRGGTSRDAARWLPDIETRVQIAPRNLNLEK